MKPIIGSIKMKIINIPDTADKFNVISQSRTMKALDILHTKFFGNFYSRFSIGDTFDLVFDDFWLIAQNVISADEKALNHFLLKQYKPADEAIDKENISKSIILCSTLRKKVIKAKLAEDSSLQLAFENGVILIFPTNTDIVDWHWAINENGNDPYLGCIVGCFGSGEVQIGS